MAQLEDPPLLGGTLGIPQVSSAPLFFDSSIPTFHSISSSTTQNSTVFPSLPIRRGKGNRKAVRSQSAIEAAILDACRTPIVQHWIMVKARLGYDTFWKHMNRLLSLGVMDETNEGSKTLYRVNGRGLEMLSQLSAKES